jgi:hypothetical protein
MKMVISKQAKNILKIAAFLFAASFACAGIFFQNTSVGNALSGILLYFGIIIAFYSLFILLPLSLCSYKLFDGYKTSFKDAFLICLLFLAIAAAALSVITRSRTVYIWDYSAYWSQSIYMGNRIFEAKPFAILADVINGVRLHHYNNTIALLVSLPLRVLGRSYTAFALCSIALFVFPQALILSALVKKINTSYMTEKSVCNFPKWLNTALIISFGRAFSPSFIGFFDAAMLVPVSALLLLSAHLNFKKFELSKYLCIALLCLSIFVIRRYFSFFVVSYVFALAAKALCEFILEKDSRRLILKNYILSMLLIGSVCAILLSIFFMPLLKRYALGNYSVIYSAYKNGGILQNIKAQCSFFGLFAVFLAVLGFINLFSKRRLRSFAVFLLVSIITAWVYFFSVQSMSLQHNLILSAQFSILAVFGIIAALEFITKNIKEGRGKNQALITAASLAGLINLSLVFIPFNISKGGFSLFSANKIMPRKRQDIKILGDIINDINDMHKKNKSVYILSSSSHFNSSTFISYNMPFEFNAVPGLLGTHDVDLRDGFPVQFFDADMVIVCDPPQNHLPLGQEVINVPAKAILQGANFGSKYKFIKEWQLDYGVKAKLFERTEPYTKEDAEYIIHTFDKLYPEFKNIFSERIIKYFSDKKE